MIQEGVVYLTEKELFDRWQGKISASTLRKWRLLKKLRGPAFVKFEGHILYPLDFIEEYEQDNTIIPKGLIRSNETMDAVSVNSRLDRA